MRRVGEESGLERRSGEEKRTLGSPLTAVHCRPSSGCGPWRPRCPGRRRTHATGALRRSSAASPLEPLRCGRSFFTQSREGVARHWQQSNSNGASSRLPPILLQHRLRCPFGTPSGFQGLDQIAAQCEEERLSNQHWHALRLH